LLQQTAARSGVVAAYRQLIADCPNANHLAVANVRELTKLVKPLGLSYRASELKDLGQVLSRDYGGQVPDDLRSLLHLPGVGDYAARAVLSFAFEQRVPVVDTNVARFLHRFFGLNTRIPSNPSRSRRLLKLANNLMPPGSSSAFNFAVLDLCAAVCLPRNPKCNECPVRSDCSTGRSVTGRKA
jgi:A/G-specific adenine glycosylase